MLQNIRDNSQGWIAKTLIGIIVMLLALTGVEAIFNVSANRGEVAEVNGVAITRTELEQAVTQQRNQLLQQLGAQFDPALLSNELLRESALKALIERSLLIQAATSSKFGFSSSSLDQIILQTPDFQVDGRFNEGRFDQVVRSLGYDRLRFRELLTQEMLIGQLQAGVAGSAFVTDQQIEAFSRLERQTRDFQMHRVIANPDAIQVGDEQIKHYYEANLDRFQSSEQVAIQYIELKKDDFFDQVAVDDAAVTELYSRQIAALSEQRRAAHILIEVSGETSDEAARAKIDELRGQLDKGEDFATLARAVSEDPGSASEGGDLGYAGPGLYDPAFDKALFALAQDEVSQPVRSEYGWHLIKLLGVQAPEVPTLEAMRPELERQLKAERVEQRFVDATRQLESAAYESADLEQPATELGIKVQEAGPFGREGGDGIAANKQVVQTAFDESLLVEAHNSALLELDPETVVVIRVKEHLKPKALPLETVRDQIVAQLKREEAGKQALTAGETILAADKGDPAANAKLAWVTIEAADRGHEGVEPVVLQKVFRMPHPGEDGKASVAGVALPNGDYVVIHLQGVNEPQEPLADELKQDYRRFLASRAGQRDFAALMTNLRETAEIERH